MNDAWYYRDGEQPFGPMPLAELQRLLREGRVSPNVLVSSAATQGAWLPSAQALAMQPALPQGDGGLHYVIPTGQTSGISFAAGWLGLISLIVCPLAPVAFVMGIMGLRDLKRHPQKNGVGRAWTGIVCGTLGTIGLVIWLFMKVFAPTPN